MLKEYDISIGIASKNIFVTKDVENTADEAVAVKELIRPSKNIILVTSAYKIFRAKKRFEKQGFNVIPYMVDFISEKNKEITMIDFLPNSNYLKNTETGLRELIRRILYIIKR